MRFSVNMPITGSMYLEVDADSAEEAIEEFYAQVGKMSQDELRSEVEWEFCHHVTKGNVVYAMLNDVEVEEV